MKYDNATLEGRRKLLKVGLLEKTIIKLKKQILFTTKTRRLKSKNYNKIQLASDKNQNKTI